MIGAPMELRVAGQTARNGVWADGGLAISKSKGCDGWQSTDSRQGWTDSPARTEEPGTNSPELHQAACNGPRHSCW